MVHIGLLRGVNVGGHARVLMSDLRECLTDLGCEDVRSLLQSGNVVFRVDDKTGASLERWLEAGAAHALDLRTDFIVRTGKELATVIARNPFPDEAARDPAHLVVMFLKTRPAAAAWTALQAAINGPEIVRGDGKHAYIVYPARIAGSRLTHVLLEQKLGTRCTGRNWNTVKKLAREANERRE